jgi:hypothetical protein
MNMRANRAMVMEQLACALASCGKTNSAWQNFDNLYVWGKSSTHTQDAQKSCSARPQRAKRRGVRFGTLSL